MLSRLVIAAPTPAAASDAPPPPPVLTAAAPATAPEDMSVRELKAALAAAGLSAVGCAEKADFVRLLREHRAATALSTPPPAAAAAAAGGDTAEQRAPEEMSIKELKAAMTAAGLSAVGCAEKADFVRLLQAHR